MIKKIIGDACRLHTIAAKHQIKFIVSSAQCFKHLFTGGGGAGACAYTSCVLRLGPEIKLWSSGFAENSKPFLHPIPPTVCTL